MKKYHIITYGCQANVADSERIASRLEKQGYKKTEQIEKANLVVIKENFLIIKSISFRPQKQ